MGLTFKGRLSRKPFIIQGLIVGVIQALNAFGITSLNQNPTLITESNSILIILLSIVSIAISIGTVVFSLSLTIRRWHDLGKSGWWTLTTLIPLVNIIVWIYLIFKKGDSETNKYGLPSGQVQQQAQQH